MKEYIYIATNPLFPDHVKIGYTSNPKHRVSMLNTSTPIKFDMPYIIEVEDAKRAEKMIHRKLKYFKTDNEFFKLSAEKAHKKITVALMNFKPKKQIMLNISLGEEIKSHRKDRGLTQHELARYANIPFSQVCNFENGKTNPTIKTVLKILSVMGLKLKIEKQTQDERKIN